MKIRIISAKEIGPQAKATIHKTGKMGFSIESRDYMGLEDGKVLVIGVNEEDEEDENLYVLIKEGINEEGFKISKAGSYFFINAKFLLLELGIDYKKNKIIYDITKMQIGDQEGFKFSKRLLNKKKNDMPTV